jgi:hypothetical protein
MKLYATTTSERASKGQGGNDYLDIIINQEKENICRVYLNGQDVDILRYSDGAIFKLHELKAEKKKAECIICGESINDGDECLECRHQ